MNLQKILKWTTIVSLFIIPVFPLIVANSFFFPFITGKAFFFRILVELAFASWVILMFIDTRYRPKITPITIAISLFAFITLVADILGVNPLRSIWSNFERMEGWIAIVHLWAFFIVITSVFGQEQEGKRLWHRWFEISLFVAVIVAVYGLFQLFGWAEIHQGSSRIDASLGNSAYMAVYMLIHAFLAVYLVVISLNGNGSRNSRGMSIKNFNLIQWVYVVIALLFSFLIFQTQTRGTILGLIGGTLVALFLYAVLAKGEPKKGRLVSAGVIVAIIVVGVVFWTSRDSSFIRDSEVLNRLATISISDVKTQARGYIWPMAVSGALERPIFGWGQENFNYIFNANYEPKMYRQEQWFDRAHSVYLDWFVASGFVGLFAYLALYVLFLVAVWKSDLKISIKCVLTGLLAAYAIHNTFVFDNLASYVYFVAILAFGSSLGKDKEVKLFGTEPARRDTVQYVVAPVTLVALVIVVYFVNARLIRANTGLIEALQTCGRPEAAVSFEQALKVNAYGANQEIREQILSCAGNAIASPEIPASTKQTMFNLALAGIEDQTKSAPKDARMYALGGMFLNGMGQFNLSESFLAKAHKLSPQKQTIAIELATAYMNTDKLKEAEDLVRAAYEAEPDYLQAKTAYAVILVLNGKEQKARKTFDNDPSIFETAQMAQVYLNRKEYSKSITLLQSLTKNNPADVNLRVRLAQVQYAAGRIQDAVATFRAIAKDYPEYKQQVDAAIGEITK